MAARYSTGMLIIVASQPRQVRRYSSAKER